MTRTTVLAVLTVFCGLTLSINLRAQGDSDVAQQIKQLQQDSRNAQMKNDVSWASSTWLTDSWQETAGGPGNEGRFHQGSEQQHEQVEERQHQRPAGGDLRSDVAVSHYTFTYEADLQGKHRARTVLCSDTWVNDRVHGKRLRLTAR